MQGISDIITVPGLVNVDFADVKTVMCNSGTAMLGVGVSSGRNRAEEAALVTATADAPPRSPEVHSRMQFLAIREHSYETRTRVSDLSPVVSFL